MMDVAEALQFAFIHMELLAVKIEKSKDFHSLIYDLCIEFAPHVS